MWPCSRRTQIRFASPNWISRLSCPHCVCTSALRLPACTGCHGKDAGVGVYAGDIGCCLKIKTEIRRSRSSERVMDLVGWIWSWKNYLFTRRAGSRYSIRPGIDRNNPGPSRIETVKLYLQSILFGPFLWFCSQPITTSFL